MKLCIDTFSGFVGYEDLLPKAAAAGFDGFFSNMGTGRSLERMQKCRELADRYGLYYETSHSYIPGCEELWKADDPTGEGYVDVLKTCIDNCRAVSVPILVIHPSFPENGGYSIDAGLSRLRRVVEYAGDAGVKLAFEDVKSYDCLRLVLDTFTQTHVGFCLDTGHNAVYMPEHDCLAEFGKRLFCTHIHDNPGDVDTHGLPGDGTIDFARIAGQLAALHYDGCLSLEVRRAASYENLDGETWLALALARIQRVRDMVQQAGDKV